MLLRNIENMYPNLNSFSSWPWQLLSKFLCSFVCLFACFYFVVVVVVFVFVCFVCCKRHLHCLVIQALCCLRLLPLLLHPPALLRINSAHTLYNFYYLLLSKSTFLLLLLILVNSSHVLCLSNTYLPAPFFYLL